jgi:hypothetical protein
LETERKELITAKSKLTKENEEKKARLEELEKQLDGFIAVNFYFSSGRVLLLTTPILISCDI